MYNDLNVTSVYKTSYLRNKLSFISRLQGNSYVNIFTLPAPRTVVSCWEEVMINIKSTIELNIMPIDIVWKIVCVKCYYIGTKVSNCGQDGMFPGLIPLIESYLSGMDVDADTHCSVQQYLKLIQKRASGDIFTMASWMRQFITTHPQYKWVSLRYCMLGYMQTTSRT